MIASAVMTIANNITNAESPCLETMSIDTPTPATWNIPE